jgi:hypothetical protein
VVKIAEAENRSKVFHVQHPINVDISVENPLFHVEHTREAHLVDEIRVNQKPLGELEMANLEAATRSTWNTISSSACFT